MILHFSRSFRSGPNPSIAQKTLNTNLITSSQQQYLTKLAKLHQILQSSAPNNCRKCNTTAEAPWDLKTTDNYLKKLQPEDWHEHKKKKPIGGKILDKSSTSAIPSEKN